MNRRVLIEFHVAGLEMADCVSTEWTLGGLGKIKLACLLDLAMDSSLGKTEYQPNGVSAELLVLDILAGRTFSAKWAQVPC